MSTAGAHSQSGGRAASTVHEAILLSAVGHRHRRGGFVVGPIGHLRPPRAHATPRQPPPPPPCHADINQFESNYADDSWCWSTAVVGAPVCPRRRRRRRPTAFSQALACSLAAVRRSLSAAAASHPQPVHSRGRKFAPTRTSAPGKGYGLELVFVINVWLLRIREHCSNASRRRLCSSMLERLAAWRCRALVRYRGYRGSAMVISGKVGVRGGKVSCKMQSRAVRKYDVSNPIYECDSLRVDLLAVGTVTPNRRVSLTTLTSPN